MNIEDYKKFHKTTMVKDFSPLYYSCGLGGEVGEVLNEIKKIHRDDDGILTPQRRENVVSELGDVMWYMIALSKKMDISLEEILQSNHDKLKARGGCGKKK